MPVTSVENYISAQSADRQNILTAIHSIIIREDKTVEPIVEPMMGKEMIVYKYKASMKYALASVQKHMSWHVLPMYVIKTLFEKYELLFHKASFQKGCINFKTAEEMPLDLVSKLISDCSTIDLLSIRENYLKEKKASKVKKSKS